MLSSSYNTNNPEEVRRIEQEHPGETNFFKYDRLLGWLGVTRGLCCIDIACIISMGFQPSVTSNSKHPTLSDLEDSAGSIAHPCRLSCGVIGRRRATSTCRTCPVPQMSSARASPRRYARLWVFGSAGCIAAISDTSSMLDIIISLANGVSDARLGHECISDGDNAAETLIKNLLFGTDIEKMKVVMTREQDPRI